MNNAHFINEISSIKNEAENNLGVSVARTFIVNTCDRLINKLQNQSDKNPAFEAAVECIKNVKHLIQEYTLKIFGHLILSNAIKECDVFLHSTFETVTDFIKAGYAGVDKDGIIVDRRVNSEAIALQANEALSIPEPKKVPADLDEENWALLSDIISQYADVMNNYNMVTHLKEKFNLIRK